VRRLCYARHLLDQILDDPANDDLRMVYADHLLARSNPRGEYIAVELGLATTARGSDQHAALLRRRAELRIAHAAAWWPELPEHRIGTRRGFVETVAASASASASASELDAVAQLADREPLSALELLDYPALHPAEAPWQERIRRLAVHGHYSTPPWEGPLGRAVEELAITHRGPLLPPLGEHLPRCRRLSLAGIYLADILDDGRQLLFSPLRSLLEGWRRREHLEALDLSCCGVYAGAIRLLASLELSALRVLRLSGNPLGPEGAAALAMHLSALPALERLELLGTDLGEERAALEAAAGSRVQLVTGAPPSRVVIDAVGLELELELELELTRASGEVSESESAWTIALDGVRTPIRLAADDTLRSHAALGRMAYRLWLGAPCRLTREGVAVSARNSRFAEEDDVLAIASDRSEVRFSPFAALSSPARPR
jgi:uncharacterized protein (TIGR02996 family)